MRNGLIFFFVVVYLSLSAQGITDDFFDGNFNKNPSWTGDSASFRVNASFQLQLYAHGPGLSSLALPSPFLTMNGVFGSGKISHLLQTILVVFTWSLTNPI
jgi:hypothetical protein